MARRRLHHPAVRRTRRPARVGWLNGRMFAVATGFGALATSVYAAFVSPAMSVRDVVVRAPAGLQPHEQRAIISATFPLCTSRLLLLRGAEVRSRLERFPWVLRADVEPILWRRAVEVKVAAREPAAELIVGGRRWEVDDDGWVIRPMRRGIDLPQVTITGRLDVSPGQRLTSERVLAGLAAVRLKRAVACLQQATISVDERASICFNNPDRVAISVGTVEDLPVKLAVVEQIYRVEAEVGRRLQEIDVSCPSVPAGKPRTAGQTDRARPLDT